VLALNGYPWFTVSDTAGVPGQPTGHTEGWAVYAAVATSGVPFDGILDDSEPYSTTYTVGQTVHNHFWESLPTSAQQYLDWLQGIRAVAGSLPVYSTVPYWYDADPRLDLALEGQAAPRPLRFPTGTTPIRAWTWRSRARPLRVRSTSTWRASSTS
jgi:hypothetical protein